MSNPEQQIEREPEKEGPATEKIPSPSNISPSTEIFTEPQVTVTHPGGEGGKFVCNICGKSFNSDAELEMHIESNHKTKKTVPKRKRSIEKIKEESNQIFV